MNISGTDLLNPETLPEIVLLVTTVAGSLLTVVSRVQRKLKDNAVQFIGRAEEKFADQENAGGTKHDYVVNKLYSQVPAVFRPFFAKKRLSGLVSGTFESVNRFSELRSSNFTETEKTDAECTGPVQTDETVVMRNATACDIDYTIPNQKGGDKTNASKINPSNQQVSGNRVLQNNSVQGAVRVFTLRGGHGLLFRAEYRVCKRHGRNNYGRRR